MRIVSWCHCWLVVAYHCLLLFAAAAPSISTRQPPLGTAADLCRTPPPLGTAAVLCRTPPSCHCALRRQEGATSSSERVLLLLLLLCSVMLGFVITRERGRVGTGTREGRRQKALSLLESVEG